ncbi:hypothetical protein BD309DRAFT_967602 [Dichomitus squalens]|nr:hypothetical protein BD309DRAFT_967602 [Dichomitus squalens]
MFAAARPIGTGMAHPPSLLVHMRGRPRASACCAYSTSQHESENPPLPRFPSPFYSLYRLLLRSAAASVLAEPDSTSTLRGLWRQVFSQATSVMGRFQSSNRPSHNRRIAMNKWLQEWDKRMDSTLELLYYSAITRGLPHQVTRNLSKMARANKDNISPPPYRLEGGVWDGTLPPDHPAYKPGHVKTRRTNRTARQRDKDLLVDRSSHMLNEVIGMAEGFGGASLGRMQRKR